MNRQVEKVGSITVLSITEPILDGTNAGEFKKAIKSLLDSCPRVVLDLGGVEFVDSCGCGAILTAVRWLDQVGGDLKLCHLTQRVHDIFSLFRMSRILEIFSSREDALRAFTRSPHRV